MGSRMHTRSIAGILALALIATAAGALTHRARAAAPVSLRGGTVKGYLDLTYGTAEGVALQADGYLPATYAANRPALVFVHGGAFWTGSRKEFTSAAIAAAAAGYVAYTIDYRLTSATPWTSEVRDVQTFVRWLRGVAPYLGVDPARIGLVGSSAGGDLALLAATAGTGSSNVDARVKAVASWSGMTDHLALLAQQPAARPMLERYTKCAVPACPGRLVYTSAITYLDPTDPPMLLIQSANEMIPVAQGAAMATAATVVGVPAELRLVSGSAHLTGYDTTPTLDQTLAWMGTHL